MNFHEYKLLKWSPIHRALTDVLLATIGQMPEEEMEDLVKNQFTTCSQTSLRSLKNSLETERSSIVPVGLLSHVNTSSAYSSSTIDVMIEMAAGKDASKLVIPLPILLRTTKRTMKECALTSPHNMIRTVILAALLAHLSLQLFISRRLDRSGANPASAAADADVVFCIGAPKKPLPSTPEPATQEPAEMLRPVIEGELSNIPAILKPRSEQAT